MLVGIPVPTLTAATCCPERHRGVCCSFWGFSVCQEPPETRSREWSWASERKKAAERELSAARLFHKTTFGLLAPKSYFNRSNRFWNFSETQQTFFYSGVTLRSDHFLLPRYMFLNLWAKFLPSPAATTGSPRLPRRPNQWNIPFEVLLPPLGVAKINTNVRQLLMRQDVMWIYNLPSVDITLSVFTSTFNQKNVNFRGASWVSEAETTGNRGGE